jgi:hypothetical protein
MCAVNKELMATKVISAIETSIKQVQVLRTDKSKAEINSIILTEWDSEKSQRETCA